MSDHGGVPEPSQGQLAKALQLLGVPDPTPAAISTNARRALLLAHIHAWSRLLMTDAEASAGLDANQRAYNHISADKDASHITALPGADTAAASTALLIRAQSYRVAWVCEVVRSLAQDAPTAGVASVTELAVGSLEGVYRVLEGLGARFEAQTLGVEPPEMDVTAIADGLHYLALAYDRFHAAAEPQDEPGTDTNGT